MTYNVWMGTLNTTHSLTQKNPAMYFGKILTACYTDTVRNKRHPKHIDMSYRARVEAVDAVIGAESSESNSFRLATVGLL